MAKHYRVKEKKKMHIALKIVLIILAVILLIAGGILLYIDSKLNMIVFEDD